MKVQIPENLKADMPQTTWGKILSATPVVMAVVSTMLAGLASSEMTRAQYDRSYAAQQQSKAGDQWSFFQAKRLRGALQRNTLDLMQVTTEVRPLEPAALKQWVEQLPAADEAEKKSLLATLESPAGQDALAVLRSGDVPRPPSLALDNHLAAALSGLEQIKPDAEMAELVASVADAALAQALRQAVDQAQGFDLKMRPVNQVVDQLERALARATGQPIQRSFIAARLRFAAARYEIEARLNQSIAGFYELLVRKSNASAERHHVRSQRFFFGMLAAQAGVIISTFAIAARKRNLLWSLAAAAGLLAVVFAIYVYLYV